MNHTVRSGDNLEPATRIAPMPSPRDASGPSSGGSVMHFLRKKTNSDSSPPFPELLPKMRHENESARMKKPADPRTGGLWVLGFQSGS
jgi:hypothetical protein